MSLHSKQDIPSYYDPKHTFRSYPAHFYTVSRPERVVLFLEFYHFRGQRDLLWRPLTDDRSPSHHTQVTTLLCTISTMPYIFIYLKMLYQ